MSLQRAYLLFAGLYSLLPVMGVIAIFFGGGTPLALVHLFFGVLGVVGLWGYMLNRGVMNQRMWRPLALVFAVGSLVQMGILLSAPVAGVELTWMLISSIFALILAVMLYHYGNRDQPLWASEEERVAASKLAQLLEQQPNVTAYHREPGHENSVRVSKLGNAYHASVTRRSPKGQETFEQRFRHPETLLFFAEKFASVAPQEFTRQEERGPQLA